MHKNLATPYSPITTYQQKVFIAKTYLPPNAVLSLISPVGKSPPSTPHPSFSSFSFSKRVQEMVRNELGIILPKKMACNLSPKEIIWPLHLPQCRGSMTPICVPCCGNVMLYSELPCTSIIFLRNVNKNNKILNCLEYCKYSTMQCKF